MDRQAAYLHQAEICTERARYDRADMRSFWLGEARKWRQRAADQGKHDELRLDAVSGATSPAE